VTNRESSPTKLDILRRQEERLVLILCSLKEEVYPKSEAMYATVAEGYREELDAIRKQIEVESAGSSNPSRIELSHGAPPPILSAQVNSLPSKTGE
jgi:hypothetical protein